MNLYDLTHDKFGGLDFHGLGPICKIIFSVFFLFLVVKNKLILPKQFYILLILFGIACYLNTYKYIKITRICPKEIYFLTMTSHEDLFIGTISLFSGLLLAI
jgi:hypothetical protein